ncbi:MAG: hypothetical protein INH41_02695 [Myxococcaceae bacterium]|jgi:hypothetical protein|nr:hypothetical protein [Myxococcaceae bacterium]MCA3011287.1 hypothetical protein [Myxococcaceae bacterium]
MLSIALTLALGAAPTGAKGPAEPFALTDWNHRRLQTNRVAMLVLGTWAVANIGVGAVGFGLERDERVRWLHLGNASWNVVNLALAIAGLAADWRKDPASFDAKQSLEASNTQEKILLVNAGLDVAYLAAGAFLWQRGEATADRSLLGFGQALLLQGGFLLLFDTMLAIVNGRLTHELMLGVEVTPAGGVGARLGARW